MRCQQSWRCILTIFRQRERNFVENSIFQIYFSALFCTRPIPLAKFEILKYVKLEREFQTFPWFSKISSQKSIIMILFEETHFLYIFAFLQFFSNHEIESKPITAQQTGKSQPSPGPVQSQKHFFGEKAFEIILFSFSFKKQSLDFWVCPTQMEMRLQ